MANPARTVLTTDSFTLPPKAMPPAKFFYNRFWMLKLRRWGWSYVHAGILAQHIAEKCYLAPYDIHVQILREATETFRNPDPDKADALLRQRVWERSRSELLGRSSV